MRKLSSGFTLIEIMLAVGIVAIILSISLVAVNPIRQLNNARDVATKAMVQDFNAATKYYFTTAKTLPWKADQTCRDELSQEEQLTDVPSCIEELTQGGQLEADFLARVSSEDIYVTECSDAIALCYEPRSGSDPEAKYTKNGVEQPGCPNTGGTSNDCYVCSFSTNEARECFEALNPHGTLALVPSPSPGDILPIPQRNSERACDTAGEGEVACMADVVSDSSGNPLSSIAPPAGFGPEQLHTSYSLPCRPGGPVEARCEQPSGFGPQTIAIVIAYHTPTIEQDLAVYSETYGLPSCTKTNGCLTVVNQNGQTSPFPPVDASWSLEASLDVQMAHAICQTCRILLVEANSNRLSDMVVAVSRAAQMGATAISNSYGSPEWSGATAYDQYYNHPGVYVTAASGDWGYGAYYPAASRHVIAVGGTTLSLFASNMYASETVWSGTGSACSGYQSAQSFQTSLSNWSQTGCGTRRAITDVSAVADPRTGVAVYDSTPYSGRTGWWVLGGTSVSSPIVAAALAMEGDAPEAGNAASAVYENPSKYRDVTSGSNGSCGGSIMCAAGAGYDGPTGLGSPNFIAQSEASQPTPTNTPVPTQAQIDCSTIQTVTLTTTDPVIALPGDTVNNILTVTSNDSSSCSTTYTVSRGFPTGWTVNGIPNSFTLLGGEDKIIPFSVDVPDNATVGNHAYQFWVAKQGQSSVNPVNGSIQVVQSGPTNTPTPTPVSCTQGWSKSLGSTSMSGRAGDTLNQTLTITNNNPESCSSAVFAISYSQPSGFTTLNLPPSVTLSGGQSITIPFTVTISTGAQIGSYITQYWVNGGFPVDATIQVVATSPAPTGELFSNFGGKLYGDYATFEFSYNAQGTSSFRLDVATDPAALEKTTGPDSRALYGFASTTGRTWDSSNITTPTSVRGFIRKSPQSWSGWQCGATVYYRMYNSGDLRIKSPVRSGIIDCTTAVDVLPWEPWYSAIYYGVYDARYDVDDNDVVDWDDYWVLVRATRLR